MSRLAAVAGVLGLAVGPEAVRGRIDAILVASWRAAGVMLVRHELAAMAGGLDEGHAGLQRARARRDALSRRLGELEAHRQAARERAERCRELLERITSLLGRLPDGEDRDALECEAAWHRQRDLDADREVALLDAAASILADELAHADRHLQQAQDRLAARRGELAALLAADEAQQPRRELAATGEAPHRWEARAGRLAGLLQLPAGPRASGD